MCHASIPCSSRAADELVTRTLNLGKCSRSDRGRKKFRFQVLHGLPKPKASTGSVSVQLGDANSLIRIGKITGPAVEFTIKVGILSVYLTQKDRSKKAPYGSWAYGAEGASSLVLIILWSTVQVCDALPPSTLYFRA